MKRNILLLAALLTAAPFILTGCIRDPEVPVINGPYIQMYYDGVLNCQVVNYNDVGPGLIFEIVGDGETDIVSYNSASTGEKKEVYDSLCNKHFDYGYHGEDPYADQPVKRCYAKDLLSISVTSDRDYDPQHPAGTPLDDIIVFNTYTPYPWIKGGYQGEPVFNRIKKYLKDLTEDDMKLLCALNLCQLVFSTAPTLSSSHRMTVTVVTDDGVTHSFEREVYF